MKMEGKVESPKAIVLDERGIAKRKSSSQMSEEETDRDKEGESPAASMVFQ